MAGAAARAANAASSAGNFESCRFMVALLETGIDVELHGVDVESGTIDFIRAEVAKP